MTGIITLSIELELGWGMHDKTEYDHLSEDRGTETKALHRILNLADRQDLSISFDVVGHLFHESCAGSHSGTYPGDYWSEDPGTDQETNPHFYAPDLVQEIQSRETDHEITTHTYSHLLADNASAEQLHDELSRVKQIHSDFGVPKPTSIVMPRNQDPDYSVLRDYGIETIRRSIDGYEPLIRNPVSKAWWLWNRSHPTSSLQMRDSLLETTVTPHPSLTAVTLPDGQSSPHPVFSAIPKHFRRARHRRYLVDAIDRTIEENSHVHLWTHVYNLANDDQWKPVDAALSHLAHQRDEGQVLIRCMNDLELTNGVGQIDE